jgi:hypothetical protein
MLTHYLSMEPLDLKRFSNFQKIRKIFILYIDLDFEEKRRREKKNMNVKKLNESKKTRRNFFLKSASYRTCPLYMKSSKPAM